MFCSDYVNGGFFIYGDGFVCFVVNEMVVEVLDV